jgi:type IV pilus assembly protein PilB
MARPRRATSPSPPAAEYGVPLFDLNSLVLDLEAVRSVSDKMLAKHRVLPLFKRGKRLFLGVADPDQSARHR